MTDQTSRGAHLIHAFWKPMATLGSVMLLTILSAAAWLADELAPRWERPTLLEILSWLPWWGWALLALTVALVSLFEGSYQQVRRREKRIELLEQELGDLKAIPRRRREEARADARLELAALVTAIGRFAAGHEKELDPSTYARAQVLRELIEPQAELRTLWTAFRDSVSALRAERIYESQQPVTEQSIRDLWARGPTDREVEMRMAENALKGFLLSA